MESEPSRKCQMCGVVFKITRTLIKHYKSKHGLSADDDVVRGTPKSPKKPCKRCGKKVSNPWVWYLSARNHNQIVL